MDPIFIWLLGWSVPAVIGMKMIEAAAREWPPRRGLLVGGTLLMLASGWVGLICFAAAV